MTSWAERSHEERSLLNPGFCANLLWHAASAHSAEAGTPMSFEEAFLVLPFVLHRRTRDDLPRSTRTSLPVWLNDHPFARGNIASRARALVNFTKEALTFAGVHGLIRIDNGRLIADAAWKPSIDKTLRDTSGEVKECSKRAEFLGKWFVQTGNAATVLALLGVRP